jgi:hypothetical protein
MIQVITEEHVLTFRFFQRGLRYVCVHVQLLTDTVGGRYARYISMTQHILTLKRFDRYLQG